MKYIIGSRPDLLGGKLIAILNAKRLAEKMGLHFLFTWEIQRGDVLSAPEELFGSDFCKPFDISRGSGHLVSDDFVNALTVSRSTETVSNNGRENTVVRCDPSGDPTLDAFLCDERFAIYLLPGEDESSVRNEIKAVAGTLPLSPAIDAALAGLRKTVGTDVTGIHVRRMDVDNYRLRHESMLSYIPFNYIQKIIAARKPGEKFIICSDDDIVTNTLSALGGQDVIRPSTVQLLTALTSYQVALFELLALASCRCIYAGRSAFSTTASLIGDIVLRDIRLSAAASDVLVSPDPVSASFLFFDRAYLKLQSGDLAAAAHSFELSMLCDPNNISCRIDYVTALGRAGSPRFEQELAELIIVFVRSNPRWTDTTSMVLHSNSAAADTSMPNGAMRWLASLEPIAHQIQNRLRVDTEALAIPSDMEHCHPLEQPTAKLSRWMLSCYFEINGDLKEALNVLTSYDNDSDLSDFTVRLCHLSAAMGDHTGCVEQGKKSVPVGLHNAQVQYYISNSQDQMQQHAQALEAAKKAWQIDQSDPMLWHHLGNMLSRCGFVSEAVVLYRGAIMIDRRPAYFWARLSQALMHLDRLDEIDEPLTHLEKVGYKEPGFAATFNGSVDRISSRARHALMTLRAIEHSQGHQ